MARLLTMKSELWEVHVTYLTRQYSICISIISSRSSNSGNNRWILRLENHSLDWLDSRLHLLTIFMIHPCSCFFFSSKAKLTPFLNSKPARTLSSITSLTLSKSSFAEHSIYKSAPMVSAIRSHKSLGAHSLPISEASVSPGEILKSDLQPRKINGMCCVDMHDLWYHPIHCKK